MAGNEKRRLLDAFLIRGRITAVEPLGPRLRLLRIAGPQTKDLSWKPGQQVRVMVAKSPAAIDWLLGVLRAYSVWNYDGESLELCVFDHGVGPGAAWARAASVGDEVFFRKPDGDFILRPAQFHLFAGEETASVAIAAMLRAVPDTATALSVLEVRSSAEALDLPGDVRWHYRGDTSAAQSATLLEAVRALALPTDPGVAYLAGEAKTIQAIRAYLVKDRGWPRRSVITKPFWTPGKTGME